MVSRQANARMTFPCADDKKDAGTVSAVVDFLDLFFCKTTRNLFRLLC